ncbi:MAG: DUF927 domain-containing protein [Clostridiales bacterium]|nr:DUF927 domain-containing protein [Clostridiales bacterium]
MEPAKQFELKTFTREQFAYGMEPYEYVYSFHANPFMHDRVQKLMTEQASAIGYKGFQKAYSAYLKSVKMQALGISAQMDNPTNFTGQPKELNAGQWEADDTGIKMDTPKGELNACAHPIMPVERLVNIDTGEEKMKIAYRKGSAWCTLIADKRTLASANKITDLAASGILVTSESAKALVRYLSDLDALNYDILPESKSVGRLGYIRGEGFSPYVEGLTFDGDSNFRSLFQAVTSRGQEGVWKQTALNCRKMSTTAKIILAASFASPLLEPLGALPFFVHLWGVDSGTGKTVALMLAASAWGNPAVGAYIKTFDATVVGHEKTAAFLNHLPLCLDELQLARDSHGRTGFDVYKLAQGVGRTRGNRGGGVDLTPTWRNTILTTGESPLTGQSAGAGAVNRVIDIECAAGQPVITDGRAVSSALKVNYGFAGRKFVERLYRDGEADPVVNRLYDSFFRTLSQSDTTEKQAMAAAAILTADTLACDWIFDGQTEPLTVEEISTFLASKASVSLGERGYAFLCDWVAQNANRFDPLQEQKGEVYGELHLDECFIIRRVFNEVVEEAGFSQKALLSYLKQKKLIRTQAKGYDIPKRINGVPARGVCLKLEGSGPSCSEMEEIL